MTSLRSRQQKRRQVRAPGIWRGRGQTPTGERSTVEHGVRNHFGISARVLSGLIIVSLVVALAAFFGTDYFYVRGITVTGTNYLDEATIFRYAGIAEMHIFWVDPLTVRRNLLDSSIEIADADVSIGWPPEMVHIRIEEREPALVWIQSGVASLVDLQGRRLRILADDETRPELMWVLVNGNATGLPGLDEPVPAAAVNGALQLQTLVAGIQQLRYHPSKGLGFHEPGGWDVWLGVGTDMPDKLLIYEALRENLLARGVTPTEINVAHPEAVYYCGSAESCYE